MPIILENTISATFLKRIKETPNAIGYQYKIEAAREMGRKVWQTLTYREFYKECRLISYGLSELGVKKADKVAILSNTRLEWALCDMAILGAQAITVPVYASNSSEDVAYILNHSEANVVFVENNEQFRKIEEKRSELPHLKKIVLFDSENRESQRDSSPVLSLAKLIRLGRQSEARILKENGAQDKTPSFGELPGQSSGQTPAQSVDPFEKNLRSAKPEDLITICYTSGTTGTPKGVMLTHENLMSVLEDCVKVLGKHVKPEKEVLLTFLPFSHILGKVEGMASFVFGWRAAYAENLDALVTNMTEVRPTVMFAVPRIFEKAHARVLAMVEASSPSKRILFAWAIDTGRRYYEALWNKKTPPLRDKLQYKIAKQTVFKKILTRFGGRLRFAICGGAPLIKEIGEFFQIIGVQTLEGYGLTETCAPVTVNTPDALQFGSVGRPLPDVSIKIAEDGEILIKSKKVFKGYYKNEEETKAAFEGEWFKSGDIGYLDSEGFLRITDRKKDMIVTSGGKNIAPLKIEKIASTYPFIAHLVVIGDQRNYLVALVNLDRNQVIDYANEHQILFSEYSELVKNPKILHLVQKMIDEINSKLASFETIKKFVILPNEFTVESGELTPSLKVKRAVIQSRYQTEIEAMYAPVE